MISGCVAGAFHDVQQPGLAAPLFGGADDQARRVLPRGLGVGGGDPQRHRDGSLCGGQDHVPGQGVVELAEDDSAIGGRGGRAGAHAAAPSSWNAPLIAARISRGVCWAASPAAVSAAWASSALMAPASDHAGDPACRAVEGVAAAAFGGVLYGPQVRGEQR